MSCGIDTEKFYGEPVSFAGYTFGAGEQPPPEVNIKENIEKSGPCSKGSRSYSIDIKGELVCCDPQEKIDASASLVSAFSESCGTFSGGGLSLDGTRVSALDVSSSNYIGSVPYSVSLFWQDPDYGSGDVENVVNSVQSVQNDESITITHTVSASASASQGGSCKDCGDCDLSTVQDYVNGLISDDSSAPSPISFSVPNNPNLKGGDCPTVTEETDPEKCFFSITKVWTIRKKLNPNSSDYGDDIKVTKCEEVSQDENGKETKTISGSISFEGNSSCEAECEDNLAKVESAMNAEIDLGVNSQSGRKANVSKTINEGINPSASYTITFPPEPDKSGQACKDNYSVSVSFGSDGVGTVSVQGSVSANPNLIDSQSENCLCQAAAQCFDGGGAAQAAAMQYYNLVKGQMGDAMQKIQGPCAQNNSLGPNPEEEDVEECEGGSISYSMSFSDKEVTGDGGSWNYNISVNRPVEIMGIQPTVGGGYCVTKNGQMTEGSASASVCKEECPGSTAPFDADGEALSLAQQYTGANNLVPQSKCSETVEGDTDENCSDKSYKWDPNGGGPNGIQNNNRKAGKGNFK